MTVSLASDRRREVERSDTPAFKDYLSGACDPRDSDGTGSARRREPVSSTSTQSLVSTLSLTRRAVLTSDPARAFDT